MKKLLFLVLPLLLLASCGGDSEGFVPGGGGFTPGGNGGGSQAVNKSGKTTTGQEISYSKAQSIADAILQWQNSNEVKKARLRTYDSDNTLTDITEFNDETLAAYSWSLDDGDDGIYMFVSGNIGYYYFEDTSGYYDPNITKWYSKYRVDPDSYNLDNASASDYASRYVALTASARAYANATISTPLEDPSTYAAAGMTLKYYSNGAGHLRIELAIPGYSGSVTEYRDYKPYCMDTIGGLTYFDYDFTPSVPERKGDYELYGDFTSSSY